MWTLSFRLSQFHGHNSWLVCEVALRKALETRLRSTSHTRLNPVIIAFSDFSLVEMEAVQVHLTLEGDNLRTQENYHG
jgi:hypothetical protein